MKDNYLDRVLEASKRNITLKKKGLPLSKLRSTVHNLERTRSFKNSLTNSITKKSLAVIAEMKKASPSQGIIRGNYNPKALALSCQKANASCLSILTDEHFFKGSLDHLSNVRDKVEIPLLRKDFIIDEYQIFESRIRGADCILLIVNALSQNQLRDYYLLAQELDLETLIEVHSYHELERALELNPVLIGINNRNLETFEVNLETTKKLAKEIPNNVLTVSESGIKTKEDVKKIRSYGVNIFLVGEILMRSRNPGKKLKSLFF